MTKRFQPPFEGDPSNPDEVARAETRGIVGKKRFIGFVVPPAGAALESSTNPGVPQPRPAASARSSFEQTLPSVELDEALRRPDDSEHRVDTENGLGPAPTHYIDTPHVGEVPRSSPPVERPLARSIAERTPHAATRQRAAGLFAPTVRPWHGRNEADGRAESVAVHSVRTKMIPLRTAVALAAGSALASFGIAAGLRRSQAEGAMNDRTHAAQSATRTKTLNAATPGPVLQVPPATQPAVLPVTIPTVVPVTSSVELPAPNPGEITANRSSSRGLRNMASAKPLAPNQATRASDDPCVRPKKRSAVYEEVPNQAGKNP